MDIIESVKTAEERAEKIRQDAVLEGQEIISSYEKKGRDDGMELVVDAKSRAEQLLSNTRLEAEREAEAIFKEADEKNKIIEAHGKARLDEAVLQFISLAEGVK